jgi:hypothetical protein
MQEFNLDIQEIDLNNSTDNVSKEISLDIKNDNSDMELKTANFGSGIELLMNDKVKQSKKSPSTNSLTDLEIELDTIDTNSKINDENISLGDNKEIRYKEKDSFQNKPVIEIAKATSQMETKGETWDGFKDINAIHLGNEEPKHKSLSREDELREKFEILRKIEELERKGANVSKKYSMDSSLSEMKGEYEFIINEKEKQNSMKFQAKVLTTMITGIEFLNGKFDPFDIKLDGWSEQINENVEDFDEIFAELHEKYKSKAKMAPEIKLLFQLASSGIMIHMTNTMFKSSLPGMDDIMRQNPDLMNHFTKAAMSSMEQSSPGLNNFMNDMGMSHSRETNEMRSMPQEYNNSSQPSSSKPSMRNEMKGPNNIDSLLSNLSGNKPQTTDINIEKNSTISVEDLENMSVGKKTSKSKRKSDKNTVKVAI